MVLGVGVVTAVLWSMRGAELHEILRHTISTVIIACPCALSLAIPTALMAGSVRALSRGILFKDPAALEEISTVDRVLCDKTGTLTKGRPVITDFAILSDEPRDRSALRELARRSHHPAAGAVERQLLGEELPEVQLTDVEEIAGEGMKGRFGEREIRLGSPAFAGVEARAEGETEIAASLGGEPLASFLIQDALKADAGEAMARLTALGLRPVLVSGDVAPVVERVAAELGVSEFFSGQSPADKIDRVRELQSAGHRVLFAGDGFNDGGALAQSDLGVARGAGADLAQEAGRLVLVHSNPAGIAEAVDCGRRTRAVVRQNLALAAGYNVLAIPWATGLLAAVGVPLLPTWAAGLAMALSSLTVVLNAARLQSGHRAAPRL
jgi:Cu+-exporting ATPase